MSDAITLTGRLSITGRGMEDLTVLRAAGGRRHFTVGTETLSLKWMRLTGANTATSGNGAGGYGGSVYVTGSVPVDGTFLATSCWFDMNQAYRGGTIYGVNGAMVKLFGTTITNSTATGGNGGAIYMTGATSSLVIDRGKVSDNEASGQRREVRFTSMVERLCPHSACLMPTADDGGSIYGLNGVTVKLFDTNVTNSVATLGEGGGFI